MELDEYFDGLDREVELSLDDLATELVELVANLLDLPTSISLALTSKRYRSMFSFLRGVERGAWSARGLDYLPATCGRLGYLRLFVCLHHDVPSIRRFLIQGEWTFYLNLIAGGHIGLISKHFFATKGRDLVCSLSDITIPLDLVPNDFESSASLCKAIGLSGSYSVYCHFSSALGFPLLQSQAGKASFLQGLLESRHSFSFLESYSTNDEPLIPPAVVDILRKQVEVIGVYFLKDKRLQTGYTPGRLHSDELVAEFIQGALHGRKFGLLSKLKQRGIIRFPNDSEFALLLFPQMLSALSSEKNITLLKTLYRKPYQTIQFPPWELLPIENLRDFVDFVSDENVTHFPVDKMKPLFERALYSKDRHLVQFLKRFSRKDFAVELVLDTIREAPPSSLELATFYLDAIECCDTDSSFDSVERARDIFRVISEEAIGWVFITSDVEVFVEFLRGLISHKVPLPSDFISICLRSDDFFQVGTDFSPLFRFIMRIRDLEFPLELFLRRVLIYSGSFERIYETLKVFVNTHIAETPLRFEVGLRCLIEIPSGKFSATEIKMLKQLLAPLPITWR